MFSSNGKRKKKKLYLVINIQPTHTSLSEVIYFPFIENIESNFFIIKIYHMNKIKKILDDNVIRGKICVKFFHITNILKKRKGKTVIGRFCCYCKKKKKKIEADYVLLKHVERDEKTFENLGGKS